MGRQRPMAVTNSLRAQAALVGVAAAGTLLTVLSRDSLLEDWARSRGGLDAIEQSGIATPAFAPVAVVALVVYGLLGWVLAVLFREGHGWARWSLLALAAGFLFAAFVTWRADPPGSFVALGAIAALIDVALIWFLVQRDSSEWVRGTELAGEREPAG